MPPTTSMEKVKQRRAQHAASSRWINEEQFKRPAFYKDEIDKFKAKGIILNCYYLSRDAQAAFKWMANQTGGKCDYLDVNNSSSAEILTGIVSKIVLNACDRGGSGELVKEYEKRFNKFMHTA